jgi:hypothetical protein
MMRFIEVNEGLRLRFPGQSRDFSAGFEMGAIAALMSFEPREFTRVIATANLDQAREIAERLNFRMIVGAETGMEVTVCFSRQTKPTLRVVARG